MTASPVRLVGKLMGGALLGKLLGFAREIEMARLLGTNIVADSFRGALTAVLLPIAPLQGDLVPSVMIPLHRVWSEQGRAAEMFACLAALFALVATALAAVVYWFAAPWVGVLVGGFVPEARELTVRLTQVMALAMPASVVAACLSSVEISVGRSRVTALRASVQNVGIMLGILLMALTGEPLWIAWGFVAAFNVIALYGGWSLSRVGALALGRIRPRGMREAGGIFFGRVRPLLAVPLADQGNYLLERFLASSSVTGTLAALDYARTLTESALFLVSQPIGFVVLTKETGEADTVRARVEAISGPMLALAIPASVFLAVFAADIVRLVFERGAFGEEAVALTAGALRGIAVGLWAATLGWVLIRLVNAAGRNGAAAAVLGTAYAANALLNLLVAPRLGSLGLGLGEAVRGLVLLGGTAWVLGCGGLLLRKLALMLPAAALLVAAGLWIVAGFAAPLSRLGVAAPVFALGVVLWFAVYLPDHARRGVRLLRRPRRATAPDAGPS